jgi:hypothetical protein
VRFERKHAWLLIGIAVWNVLTYLMFARNLANADGRATGYYVAHTVLIVVNLLIAAVLAVLGVRAFRATRREPASER